MRVTPILLAVALAGCGKAEPEPSKPEPGKPNKGIVVQSSGARHITKENHAEIVKAFHDNPIAAKEKYAGVRWRFTALVYDIATFGSIRTVIKSGDVGGADIHMRSTTEAAKVRREAEFTIEAEIKDWRSDVAWGIEFRDGIVIAN